MEQSSTIGLRTGPPRCTGPLPRTTSRRLGRCSNLVQGMYINPQNFFALYFHLSNPILIHSCIFSPNYRDGKSLTPVYHSVINPTDPVVTETLLHDHGLIGSQDLQGWQEVHQVGALSLYSFVVVTVSVTLVSFLILSVLHSASIGGVPGHLNDRLMTD